MIGEGVFVPGDGRDVGDGEWISQELGTIDRGQGNLTEGFQWFRVQLFRFQSGRQ